MTSILVPFVIGLVIGFGGGWAWGWNRALHPDKLQAQMKALVDAATALEQKIKSKL